MEVTNSNLKKNVKRIGILAPPMGQANIRPLLNLILIINAISNEATVILTRSQQIDYFDIPQKNLYVVIHRSGTNPISKTLQLIQTQTKIAISMLKHSQDIDIWIFFIGDLLFIPMIVAKVLRKPAYLMIGGNLEKEAELSRRYSGCIMKLFKRINLVMSEGVILFSENLIKEWELENYQEKIFVAHRHFIDFNKFYAVKKYDERSNIIGYIGRLSMEKGIQHFVQALPAAFSDRQDLRVLIGGDGPLKESIEASLQEGGVTARVDLPGWISHDDLPRYLNRLRLLVLPSYSEGLPNIMLEAMACGTPVLATPVGAIPDVIIDGKTGFIMENNSPECIAENVIRALNSPDLERIAENGRRFVEKNFTFEKVVENWKKVLQDIS